MAWRAVVWRVVAWRAVLAPWRLQDDNASEARAPGQKFCKKSGILRSCQRKRKRSTQLTMEVPIGSCACPVPAVPDPMPKAECAEGLPIAPVPAAAIVPAAMPHAPIEDIPEYNELWPVI